MDALMSKENQMYKVKKESIFSKKRDNGISAKYPSGGVDDISFDRTRSH